MIIEIEENNPFAELIFELKREYDNLNDMYPPEWLTKRSDKDDN